MIRMIHSTRTPKFRLLRSSSNRGWTLIELMIATVILGTAVLSIMASYGNIAKSVHMSKSRTLANSLAMEKIESLKNISYYRLLATTAPVTSSEPGLPTYAYDESVYPTENLSVGDIRFLRRVYIQKASEVAGNLVQLNWYEQDTGLKLITCHVLWQENGVWKKVEQSNIRDNPNRLKIDAVISGVVSGGSVLPDATVTVLQNASYKGTTNAGGAYSINVGAGTYDVRAAKLGFFPITQPVTVAANQTITANFSLPPMGFGSVSGIAYINDRLLVSGISAVINGNPQLEYVELYNPTDTPIFIFDGTNPAYQINFSLRSTPIVTPINPAGTTKYVATVVPPNGYYLIASSPVINGVMADAYYSDAGLIENFPADRIPSEVSGGVAIMSLGLYEVDQSTVDAMGWGKSGGAPYGPVNAREGGGFRMLSGPGADGFASNEVLRRKAYSTSTVTEMSVDPVGAHALFGNAYDENDNGVDWVHHIDNNNAVPRNSSIIQAPQAGRPAIGGIVFVNDGLSSTGIVTDTPFKGSFTVPNVATGTWNTLISSTGWVYSNESVTVNNLLDTALGSVFLSTPASGGFISGQVVTSGGVGLPNILVSASGESDITDSNGNFWLSMEVGTYIVIANPGNANSLYTVGYSPEIEVSSGTLTIADPLVLFQGGAIRGFVSTNGIDPLPGVPIIATNTAGVEMGSSISDSLGRFTFADMPAGSYTLTPQLEVGESSMPSHFNQSIAGGSNIFVGTFTVSNAFGTIEGKVHVGAGIPIKTGVLLVAVPAPTTIGSTPPTNTHLLRAGPVVYYHGTSESDGSYTLPVRGGMTYNVYAWYTQFQGETPATVQKTGTATVSPGQASQVNFIW